MRISGVAAFAGIVGLACTGGMLLPPPSGVGFIPFVAAGLMQGVAANYATELTQSLRARFTADYIEGFAESDPGNEVAAALRRAYLKATSELIRRWRLANRQGLPEADEKFAQTLQRWTRRQETQAEVAAWIARQQAEQDLSSQLQSAFEAEMAADRQAGLETIAAEARQALELLALEELRAAGNAAEPAHFLARLLGMGGQPAMPAEADVPAGFGAMFRGDGSPAGGWFDIFVRAIAAELKRPNSTFRTLWQAAQLSGMDAMLKNLSSQVSEAGKQISEVRDDVAALLAEQTRILAAIRAQGAPILYLPEGTDGGDTSFARFFYRSRWTDFVGRNQELAWLEACCLDQSPGLMLSLVTGPGGHGKSRLALEHAWHMKLSYGWEAGFLDFGEDADWGRWQPERPTLIIVDYAAGRVGTVREIAHALARRDDLQFPVHILLLERYGDMADTFERRSGARSWCHRLTEGDDVRLIRERWSGQIELQAQEMEELAFRAWAIMIETFAAKEIWPDQTPEELLAQLHAVDPTLSPLFAVLVADALADGKQVHSDTRYEFLVETLQRSGLVRDDGVGEHSDRVRSLVALATLVRGVDLSILRRTLVALEAAGVAVERFKPRAGGEWGPLLEACNRFTGRPQGSRIHGLEPDLLGEALILNHCDPEDADGPDRAEALRRVGWAIPSEGAHGYRSIAEMMVLMAQDFGKRAIASTLYAPLENMPTDLARSYLAMIGDLCNVAPDAARPLYAAAIEHIDVSDPDVRLMRAKAAFNIVNETRDLEGLPAAIDFYRTELVIPSEPPDTPDEVLIERAKSAFNLCNSIHSKEGIDQAISFFRQNLVMLARRPGIPAEVVREWAAAAFNLTNWLRETRGIPAALAFFEEELREPAHAAAWEEINRSEFLVLRAQAAFNLCKAIGENVGLQPGLAFYNAELRPTIEETDAPDGAHLARAQAASDLCLLLRESEGEKAAFDFYVEELVIPAEREGAPSVIQVQRTRSAFNLCNAVRRDEGARKALEFYRREIFPRIAPVQGCTEGVARAFAAILLTAAETDDFETFVELVGNEWPKLQAAWDEPDETVVKLMQQIEGVEGQDPPAAP